MTTRIPLVGFCCLTGYLLFFYHLGTVAFLGADEPRYAQIGKEMWLQSEWVTPTLNGRPWLEKPPLLFWGESISYRLFGMSEWAARLPVVLLALIGVLAVGAWGYQTGGWRRALISAWVLASAPMYWIFGRFASTDMPLTALMTVAFLFGFLATNRRSLGYGAGLGAALGLAALAKGPVAVLLIAAVFLAYFWLIQQYLWSLGQTVAAVAAMLLFGMPWYWQVWQENGYDFVATFWLNHHLARFLTDIHHHSQPFWYYLPVALIGFFPWSCFLGTACLRMRHFREILRNPEHRHLVLLWLWVVIPLLFFTLAESKLPGYILPIFPALALLVAYEWDRHVGGDLSVRRLIRGELAVFSAASLMIAGILIFGFHFVYHSLWTGVVLAVPVGLMLLAARYAFARKRPVQVLLSLITGMTLFAALLFWRAGPVVEDYHSARDLSLAAHSSVSIEEPLILYRYFHHTAQYYTDYQTTREALGNLEQLQAYLDRTDQRSYLVLTQRPGWEDLQAAYSPELVRHEGNLYLVRLHRE